ncbi:hypothetical protein M422DRAFT_54932 [Sphaerobolus stellatus SS14]|uniref:Nitronate monooxygenase domain-containing protein n=1 Tax=Sphaerobolus stellatus (strain SS14) TaxID=990650 RepID=A0A0C9UQL2_SPHS4|nr:hypothetical protein M422DRAFT_56332 [Sphaerobolus stellatus SS14]KIJ27691.1 hypothetical protein M422DRAFT_54932 [Sphaerobolus stellatus SS14]
MQPIYTKYTRATNISVPITLAPMYYASTPQMIIEAARAGAFGFIAAGFDSSLKLKTQMASIRDALEVPQGQPVSMGVGLLGWILDLTETSDDPRIPAVLEEMPTAIWFAFGSDLGRYVAQVRDYDSKRDHKTTIYVIVSSVTEALCAANEWKVDVLVVQGIEAGGHGTAAAPPLFNLLPRVLEEISDGPLILAAGGISTGSQIAALLAMGADGVAMGTRFLFTTECMYNEDMKSVLVESDLNSTTRGLLFDDVNPTPTPVTWPEGIDGRAIVNKLVTDFKEGLSLDERKKRYAEAKQKAEKDRLIIWAGVGVGNVQRIMPTMV